MCKETVPIPADSESPARILQQVYALCSKVFPDLKGNCNGIDAFGLASDTGKIQETSAGILNVQGRLSSSALITVHFEVSRIPKSAVDISHPFDFFKELASLTGPSILLPLRYESSLDYVGVWAEVRIHPKPLGPARQSALLGQIHDLQDLSSRLDTNVVFRESDPDLEAIYAKFKDHVEIVYPLALDPKDIPEDHLTWARDAHNCMSAGMPVALATPYSAVSSYALALLALVGSEFSHTISLAKAPMIPDSQLISLAEKIPGILSLRADQVHFGVQTYERSGLVKGLLSRLQSVVFFGTYARLQVLFQGGQGDTHDPLSPVVLHAPQPRLDVLMRHTSDVAVRHAGGMPVREQTALCAALLTSLQEYGTADSIRLLPKLVEWGIHRWKAGSRPSTALIPEVVDYIARLEETLGGLCVRRKQVRSASFQERLQTVVDGDQLLPYFKQHLYCQDEALEEVVGRLESECFTRDPCQPIRLCLQGTPGSGKSQTAVLLARKLGIPYVNFDAASLSDHHTAISQLLGSGRGIVHSDKCGRLEEAAKHFQGAVIECSDLDHAAPSVRPIVADVFLQALETGEAQSSMGNLFSCVNLIFVFTMNLPNGADEAVRKKIGFHNELSRREVRENVVKHIKEMLSSAFLSRVGTPILFEPLDGEALKIIVEREILSSVALAAKRLNVSFGPISLEANVGKVLVSLVESDVTAFGARSLIEFTRCAVAEGILRNKDLRDAGGSPIKVTVQSDGKLRLIPQAVPETT